MSGEGISPHVAYRAVLLAAGLLLFGLLFRQLVTPLLALLVTVIIAIPLAAAATRLERLGVPRPLGALLTLASTVGALALIIGLLIPPFIDQTNEFVDDVPGIVDDLEGYYADLTGQDASQVGDRVQEFFENWTDDPGRFIGPITSIGLNVAGILAALVLILITAYYMAVRPQPLVDGLVSLAPPSRRDHVRHVLNRLRAAWIGWLQGVGVDMVVSGVLVFIALTIIGLEFAIFFAVLSACWWWSRTSARSPARSRRCCSRSPTAREGASRARRLHTRPAGRGQRDRPARHVADGANTPGDDRDRRRRRRPAVRCRGSLRRSADPVVDRDLHGRVLGQAHRGGGTGTKTRGARAAAPAEQKLEVEEHPLRPAS
jgi:hypothetical protein